MRLRLHDNSHYIATLEDGREVYLDRVSHILADVGIGPKFGRGSREAADIGTQVHDAIRDYLRHGAEPVGMEVGPAANSLALFQEFWGSAGLTPLWVERQVASLRLCYAGTADLFALDAQGRPGVLDWKTSKPLTSKNSKAAYKLQVAAYALACEEMGLGLPAWACVVRLGKEDAAPDVTWAWRSYEEASELLWAWEQTVGLAAWMREQKEAA